MSNIASIDLHPEKLRGDGPEAALRACRDFLERRLAAGDRSVRIITGLGTRGDGTPRLRTRVEQDVLSRFFSRIEQQGYEQNGAVIRVWFKAATHKPSNAWLRHQRQEKELISRSAEEERLMVGFERLESAELALEDGDWRRCRLKLNQVAREFEKPLLVASEDWDAAMDSLVRLRKHLESLDQG